MQRVLDHRGKHPLRGTHVRWRVFCDRRGAGRDTDAERSVIEVAVGRVPEGGDVQRSAGMILRGGWCLRHRRDSHRLAPLEFNVNDQNAP